MEFVITKENTMMNELVKKYVTACNNNLEAHRGYAELMTEITKIVVRNAHEGITHVESQELLDVCAKHLAFQKAMQTRHGNDIQA